MLVAMFFMPTAVFAHGKEEHKGKGIEAVIISGAGTEYVIKTTESEYTLQVSKDTNIEIGAAKATLSQMTPGTAVTIFGTKLPGKIVVAKEILIHLENKDGSPKGHNGTEHKH